MAISGTKGQGWRAIPTQYRKVSDILTSTLAAFLFSSHPKRERDRTTNKKTHQQPTPQCKLSIQPVQSRVDSYISRKCHYQFKYIQTELAKITNTGNKQKKTATDF